MMSSPHTLLRSLACLFLVAAATGCTAVPYNLTLSRPDRWAPGASLSPQASADTTLLEVLNGLPLYFIENAGQLPSRVAYYLQGRETGAFFTRAGVLLSLSSNQQEGAPSRAVTEADRRFENWGVQVSFINPNSAMELHGQDITPAVVSYFKGRPDEWRTGLSTFSSIKYRDLWPDIDLEYTGHDQQLKYTYVVHPGGDPAMIQLRYEGATAVWVDHSGQLVVETPAGNIREDRPYVYQVIENTRTEVVAQFAVSPDSEPDSFVIGFELGAYDPRLPLIIDPIVLVYASFLGGADYDQGYDIAVDSSGSAYLTGWTRSTETTFPETVGPDLAHNGTDDVFVAKLNAAGTGLVYAGFIGGTGGEDGWGIAVDEAANAYIVGSTSSTEASFPVVGGPDLTINGGTDVFVAKVNPTGTALVFCGYIGGVGSDNGRSIAVDQTGQTYITGFTTSSEASFPVTTGPDLSFNGVGSVGYGDAFVAKINPGGASLVYAGYIGGAGDEVAYGIAVDGSGRAYVTGQTESSQSTFPVQSGPDLTYNGGPWDSFVARVANNGASLNYGGYIGGGGTDIGNAVAVNSSGEAFVTGYASSDQATFPVTVGPDLTYGGTNDAFVAKVTANGMALAYAGYIGGNSEDYGVDIAVDGSGNSYVVGRTSSTESSFPVTGGPDLTHNGLFDTFVAKVNPTGAALTQSGYVGGAGQDMANGGALDPSGNYYVTGWTGSNQTTFPDGDGFGSVPGLDQSHNGIDDAFVAKVGDPTAVQQRVFLPVAVRDYCSGFTNGYFELEPNNNVSGANGPLCKGVQYSGYANDTYDVFYVDSGLGQITVNLANHPGQSVQMILYYQDTGHEVAKDTQGPTYDISYSGQPGRYYLSIFTGAGFNSTTSYSLRTVYP